MTSDPDEKTSVPMPAEGDGCRDEPSEGGAVAERPQLSTIDLGLEIAPATEVCGPGGCH